MKLWNISLEEEVLKHKTYIYTIIPKEPKPDTLVRFSPL